MTTSQAAEAQSERMMWGKFGERLPVQPPYIYNAIAAHRGNRLLSGKDLRYKLVTTEILEQYS
jgi:hypothetical protein